MHFASTGLAYAHQLDQQDDLARFREEFVITDPDLIYLDGNSLGRLPLRTVVHLQRAVEQSWGDRLIRLWNDGWIGAPQEIGSKIARLIGAHPDEVIVCDSTSVNLFKLAVAALRLRPGRRNIISDQLNFPSDLYIFQGIIDLLGQGHRLCLLPSSDGIAPDPGALEALLDRHTALLSLSLVAFKSAYLYDLADVTALAQRAGALVLWDLSHAVGAVPLDLNAANVDLAVGCTYKYLNGGPGSPAFLFVRRALQQQLSLPIWGWFAADRPFEFDLDFKPAAGIQRFQVGTPPMLSLQAIGPAVDLLLEAGMERLRRKSLMQSEYLIYLAQRWLLPLGFSIGSPLAPLQRGSHVSLRHPQGYRINRALIESPPPAVRVIPDFRAPDNLRLGIAPLYTSFTDIHRALDRIRTIVEQRLYLQYSSRRNHVT